MLNTPQVLVGQIFSLQFTVSSPFGQSPSGNWRWCGACHLTTLRIWCQNQVADNSVHLKLSTVEECNNESTIHRSLILNWKLGHQSTKRFQNHASRWFAHAARGSIRNSTHVWAVEIRSRIQRPKLVNACLLYTNTCIGYVWNSTKLFKTHAYVVLNQQWNRPMITPTCLKPCVLIGRGYIFGILTKHTFTLTSWTHTCMKFDQTDQNSGLGK